MYINGIGRTKFGAFTKNLPELTYEAMVNAIKDSPLDITEIDAIFVSNFLGGPLNGQLRRITREGYPSPVFDKPCLRISPHTA